MLTRRKVLAAALTAAVAGCVEQVDDAPSGNSTTATGESDDDEPTGYRTTRAIEAQEISMAIPGEALLSASMREPQSEILAGGQVLVSGDVWAEDGELVQTGTLALEDANVLFSVAVLDEWDVPGLREAAASGGLSPGDSVFPGDTLVRDDVRAVEGRTLVRELDEGASESAVAGFLAASGALIPGDMWDVTDGEEAEVLRGGTFWLNGAAYFPGDTWSPGDEVFPGDTWFPGDTLFPGDSWSPSDSLFPGGMWSFGEQLFRDDMAFVEGSGGLEEHHADLDPDWLALLENGGILLPSDTFIAARGGPSIGS